MRHLKYLLFFLLFLSYAFAEEYKIDTAHSSVEFSVSHLMISHVKGAFDEFEGSFQFNSKKPQEAKATVRIKAESINTKNKKRDDHLKGEDFFDIAKHPQIEFEGTRISDYTDKGFKLHGNLKMHGVTQPVILDVIQGGATQFQDTKKIAFSAKTKVSRKAFNMTWNKVLETGGFAIGDEVQVSLEIEANQI